MASGMPYDQICNLLLNERIKAEVIDRVAKLEGCLTPSLLRR